jgi:hypothetical protein
MWHLSFESRVARDLLGESRAHDRAAFRASPRASRHAELIEAATTPVMADSMGRRAHESIGTTVQSGCDEIVRERFERSPIRTLRSALRSAIRRSSG